MGEPFPGHRHVGPSNNQYKPNSSVHAEEQENITIGTVCRKAFTFFLIILTTVLFLLIGPCLCFLKMGPGFRMLILWVWLALTATFFGFSVRFLVFNGVTHVLAPFDQRRLVAKTSSIFCDALEVNSSTRADFYSFEHNPKTEKELFSYSERHNIRLTVDEFAVFPFYLLRGSDLIANATSVTPITLTVLRGEGEFKRWLEGHFHSKRNMTGKELEKEFSFESNEFISFVFTPEKFDPGGENHVDVSVIFSVKRKRIDLTASEKYCKNVKYCYLDYGFNSGQTVVMDVPFFNRSGRVPAAKYEADDDIAKYRESGNLVAPPTGKFQNEFRKKEDSDRNLAQNVFDTSDNPIPYSYYSCVPNLYVYLFLFLLVPVSIGSLGSGIIYACQRGEGRPEEYTPVLAQHSKDPTRKYSNIWLY